MSTTTVVIGLVVAIVMAWMAYIIIDQAREIRGIRRRVYALQATLQLHDTAEIIRAMRRHPSQRNMPLRETEIEE